jgi:hypothetical protein
MIPVILETPYSGDVEGNAVFLNACMRDCFARGEAPFASHGLYTKALDDLKPEDRKLGIEAGFAWRRFAEKVLAPACRLASRIHSSRACQSSTGD